MTDFLYATFEKHINNLDIEKESHADFITKVVDDTMNQLQQRGFISLSHELDLRDEIEFTVITMLRKKIYGHFNLDEFRRIRRESKDYLA